MCISFSRSEFSLYMRAQLQVSDPIASRGVCWPSIMSEVEQPVGAVTERSRMRRKDVAVGKEEGGCLRVGRRQYNLLKQPSPHTAITYHLDIAMGSGQGCQAIWHGGMKRRCVGIRVDRALVTEAHTHVLHRYMVMRMWSGGGLQSSVASREGLVKP